MSDHGAIAVVRELAGDEAHARATSALTPWFGWATLCLLRYCARLDEAVARLPAAIDAVGAVDRLQWTARDDQLSITFDGLKLSCRAASTSDLFVPDARSFRAAGVASYVAEVRHLSIPEQRLWRWAPGKRLIAHLVTCVMVELGSAPDSEGWLSLSTLEAGRLLRASDKVITVGEATARELAAWLGDAELAAPSDDEAIGLLWKRHALWIQSLISVGESAVAGALPELTRGSGLVRACEQLIARTSSLRSLREVVRILRAHPEVPPSGVLRRLMRQVAPGDRTGHEMAAIIAPYLLERAVDRSAVLATLQAMATVAAMSSDNGDPPVDPELLLATCTHAPTVALAMITRGLRARDRYVVCRVAGLLIAIGDAWCVDMLSDVLAETPPHASVISDARAELNQSQGERPLTASGDLWSAASEWRTRLGIEEGRPRPTISVGGRTTQ